MGTQDGNPVECTCSAATPPVAVGRRRRAFRVALLILQGAAYVMSTARSAIDIVSKLT